VLARESRTFTAFLTTSYHWFHKQGSHADISTRYYALTAAIMPALCSNIHLSLPLQVDMVNGWVEPKGGVQKPKGSLSSAAARLYKLALSQQNAAMQEVRKLQEEHADVRISQQVGMSLAEGWMGSAAPLHLLFLDNASAAGKGCIYSSICVDTPLLPAEQDLKLFGHCRL
jgi:hypothetical protein